MSASGRSYVSASAVSAELSQIRSFIGAHRAELEELDALRYWRVRWLVSSVFVVFAIVGGFVASQGVSLRRSQEHPEFIDVWLGDFLPGLLFGAMASALFVVVFGPMLMNRYRERFRASIARHFLAAVMPDTEYLPERHVSPEAYEASGLFSTNWHEFRGEDLIRGKRSEFEFEISELRVTRTERTQDSKGNSSSRTVVLFAGLFGWCRGGYDLGGRITLQAKGSHWAQSIVFALVGCVFAVFGSVVYLMVARNGDVHVRDLPFPIFFGFAVLGILALVFGLLTRRSRREHRVALARLEQRLSADERDVMKGLSIDAAPLAILQKEPARELIRLFRALATLPEIRSASLCLDDQTLYFGLTPQRGFLEAPLFGSCLNEKVYLGWYRQLRMIETLLKAVEERLEPVRSRGNDVDLFAKRG